MTAFKSLYVVLWVFAVSVARAVTSTAPLSKMNHDDIFKAASDSADTLKTEIKKLNSRD